MDFLDACVVPRGRKTAQNVLTAEACGNTRRGGAGRSHPLLALLTRPFREGERRAWSYWRGTTNAWAHCG